MDSFNLDRFQSQLKSQGLQAALFSNPATLTWLTGYAPPIQTGPNPFEGGPAVGWWLDGELTLILSDAEAGAAAALGFKPVTISPTASMNRCSARNARRLC